MKRLLLFFAVTLITGLSANAQCTPDPQYTEPGVYPDSATGFAPACVNDLYEQLITNVVPVDTTTMVGPIPVTLVFDSVIVTSVTGLPPGFTFVCYDGQNVISPVDQCAFEGGTTGCVLISGTPAPGDEGTYNLSIVTEAYLGGLTTPQATIDVDYYVIEVLAAGACTNSLDDLSSVKFNLFPNPANDKFTLNGLGGINIDEISIVSSNGQVLSTYTDVNNSTIDVTTSDLESGMYFVKIAHGSSIDVVRFIKE